MTTTVIIVIVYKCITIKNAHIAGGNFYTLDSCRLTRRQWNNLQACSVGFNVFISVAYNIL